MIWTRRVTSPAEGELLGASDLGSYSRKLCVVFGKYKGEIVGKVVMLGEALV